MGRLRPDFLDRCKPAALLGNSYLFHLEIGSYIDPGCTETDQALLDDGRSSFPSGEALWSLGCIARALNLEQGHACFPWQGNMSSVDSRAH